MTDTQYVALVYETRGTNPALVSVRDLAGGLTATKAMLDAEVVRQGQSPLSWRNEFGGARAVQHGLTYDIRPVRSHVPPAEPDPASLPKVLFRLHEGVGWVYVGPLGPAQALVEEAGYDVVFEHPEDGPPRAVHFRDRLDPEATSITGAGHTINAAWRSALGQFLVEVPDADLRADLVRLSRSEVPCRVCLSRTCQGGCI